MVKSPKFYFYDTGLACSLLGIRSHAELVTHYLRGELFENFIIAELLKSKVHHNLPMDFFFWRDNAGHEIDCLVESGAKVNAIEIKSAKTFNADFLKA